MRLLLLILLLFGCSKQDNPSYEELTACKTFVCEAKLFEKVYNEFEIYRVAIQPDKIDVYFSFDKGHKFHNASVAAGFIDYPVRILSNTKESMVVLTYSGKERVLTRSNDGVFIDNNFYREIEWESLD